MTGDRLTGLLVKTSGAAEVLTVPSDWRELNAAIGAPWGQTVSTILPGIVMWVDEEGRLAHKPMNVGVSFRLYPGVIAGDVFLLGVTTDGEADVASLTDTQLVDLAGWFDFTPADVRRNQTV